MKNVLKISFIFLNLILLLNCNVASTNSLKQIDFEFFEMTVPKNWKKIKSQGIDSHVGALKMDNNEKIYYDYGYYSNKLIDLEKGNDVTYEKIDGLSAKIISAKNQYKSATGIYFDSIKFVKNDSMRIRLQFSGKNLSRTNESKILESFRTLKFKN